jgi:U3 small nucleolar RNA-associated protein 22
MIYNLFWNSLEILSNTFTLSLEFVYLSQKRDREEASDEDPIDVLKAVGEAGKGFVKSVHFLKAPRLMN